MTESRFFDCVLELSTEFDRYILSHPEMAEKIPQDALIVFILENDPEFNEKSLEIARKQHQPNQSIVKVKMQELLPPMETRLVNPKLELALNI